MKRDCRFNPKSGPKTPRKTIESWMLKAGIPEEVIKLDPKNPDLI
jgi:hypothetical protein